MDEKPKHVHKIDEKKYHQRVIHAPSMLDRILQRAVVERAFRNSKTATEQMHYGILLRNIDCEIVKTIAANRGLDSDGDVIFSGGKLLGNKAGTLIIDEFVMDEPNLVDLLQDVGEKEDKSMQNLGEKKIKSVTIECADGTTYTGVPVRVEGCPYDYRSMTVEAKIDRQAAGAYGIKNVKFENPATIVEWTDGTKTVVCCMDNAVEKEKIVNGKKIKTRRARPAKTYSKEVGLAMCIAKKHYGNKGSFNEVFKKFIPEYDEPKITVYIEDKDKEVSEVADDGSLRKLTPEETQAVKEEFFGGEKKKTEDKPKRATNIDKGKIKALAEAGWDAEQIAEEMGLGVSTVYKHLKELR